MGLRTATGSNGTQIEFLEHVFIREGVIHLYRESRYILSNSFTSSDYCRNRHSFAVSYSHSSVRVPDSNSQGFDHAKTCSLFRGIKNYKTSEVTTGYERAHQFSLHIKDSEMSLAL